MYNRIVLFQIIIIIKTIGVARGKKSHLFSWAKFPWTHCWELNHKFCKSSQADIVGNGLLFNLQLHAQFRNHFKIIYPQENHYHNLSHKAQFHGERKHIQNNLIENKDLKFRVLISQTEQSPPFQNCGTCWHDVYSPVLDSLCLRFAIKTKMQSALGAIKYNVLSYRSFRGLKTNTHIKHTTFTPVSDNTAALFPLFNIIQSLPAQAQW